MRTNREKPIVLLVDDDASLRMIASVALSDGFDVVECVDGRSALAAFDAVRPDVVLLDVVMPGLDGYDVCTRIRDLPGGTATPVLMMTGLDDVASIEAAYDCGATDFITKPLNYTILGHRLRYSLRATRAFRDATTAAGKLERAQRLARLAQWEHALATGEFRWSPIASDVFGIEGAGGSSTIEAGLFPLVHPEDRARVAALVHGPHRTEFRIVLPSGERVVHQEAQLVIDPDTGEWSLLGATQDVTELRVAERKITQLALFDGLTGLPNRNHLRDFLAKATSEAVAGGTMLAVLALDLDLFKQVNDTLGHPAGDSLLREVSTRIRSCIRMSDGFSPADVQSIAARVGGDEFIVVLRHIGGAADAAVVARRLTERLAQSYTLGATEVFVSSSVGIALFPDAGADVDELLKRADAALYHAKDRGRNNFQFYDDSIQAQLTSRMRLENRLRASLARAGIVGSAVATTHDEFSVHYQPKVDITTGRVVGTEALVRWSPPEGRVSPADFIPLAENTGLIVGLGEWVLRRACEQARRWMDDGNALSVAVNISARQFRDADLVARVARVLDETRLPAAYLELEITEGMVMADTAASNRILTELKAMGVRIALDDFGTGYSSLNYLTRFPIDTLKIDRSFIRVLGDGAKGDNITAAIIALSNSLEIDVVAEGVETKEQLAILEGQGCGMVQGFYFAPPMDAAATSEWLQTRDPAPSCTLKKAS